MHLPSIQSQTGEVPGNAAPEIGKRSVHDRHDRRAGPADKRSIRAQAVTQLHHFGAAPDQAEPVRLVQAVIRRNPQVPVVAAVKRHRHQRCPREVEHPVLPGDRIGQDRPRQRSFQLEAGHDRHKMQISADLLLDIIDPAPVDHRSDQAAGQRRGGVVRVPLDSCGEVNQFVVRNRIAHQMVGTLQAADHAGGRAAQPACKRDIVDLPDLQPPERDPADFIQVFRGGIDQVVLPARHWRGIQRNDLAAVEFLHGKMVIKVDCKPDRIEARADIRAGCRDADSDWAAQ